MTIGGRAVRRHAGVKRKNASAVYCTAVLKRLHEFSSMRARRHAPALDEIAHPGERWPWTVIAGRVLHRRTVTDGSSDGPFRATVVPSGPKPPRRVHHQFSLRHVIFR